MKRESTRTTGKAPLKDVGSTKPLVEKLGIRQGMRICLIDAPSNYFELIGEVPSMVELSSQPKGCGLVHIFSNDKSALRRAMKKMFNEIPATSMVWISWYKKSSGLETELTEDVIREIILPLGFVDVKVCRFDDQWSALKVVIRLSNRQRL